MQDFEKLGVFYLGKEFNLEEGKLEEELVLYKSKDLTTHAVIIGMTGSGKTGLGIDILEEAALDNIPVIAIDPKGDLGNLALTFPKLLGEDFRPWINLSDAGSGGLEPDQYAQQQADLWREKLAEWGQDGNRIQKFRDAAEITVYTPGGSAGQPVSLLQSFQAPSSKVREDSDAYRDQVQITTTGLLSLTGWEGDPFTSREHILTATILAHHWDMGKNLGLPELISAIQSPPFEKIGVMDLDSFYPAKERFALAMQLNNLLASPSFKVWMEGDPLDAGKFFYNEAGKPCVSIFSIAHLSDKERMFFVTMLLNELLSWVRSQPGTGSLRAILYMDEIFGYLPPTANPPSKGPLLTLLKQARAYGLGLVLSTQNPVDLDYKALSNAGTWFIGRLQTEQDKERVISGLEGASSEAGFDRSHIEKILSGLGKRLFYLHSVHQDAPVIFNTRWTMSYLAGPLTRDQIVGLPSNKKPLDENPKKQQPELHQVATGENFVQNLEGPILDAQIKQVYLPFHGGEQSTITYKPSIIGCVDIFFNSAKYEVSVSKEYTYVSRLQDGPVPLDWKNAQPIQVDLGGLEEKPVPGAVFESLPVEGADGRNYDNWEKQFIQFIRSEIKLKLFLSTISKLISEPGEDERAFRIRLQHQIHETRDKEIEALRKKYAPKMDILENRLRRAEQALENKNSQATQKKMEAAVSAGTAILGALFGRKSISATSISRVGTAMRSTGRALQSGEGISQSQETLEAVKTQLAELGEELNQQVEELSASSDVANEKLEEVEIVPTSGNITLKLLALAWVPEQ